jgi:hypothetical protein
MNGVSFIEKNRGEDLHDYPKDEAGPTPVGIDAGSGAYDPADHHNSPEKKWSIDDVDDIRKVMKRKTQSQCFLTQGSKR